MIENGYIKKNEYLNQLSNNYLNIKNKKHIKKKKKKI